MNIIALIISLVGLLLSIGNTLYLFYTNRAKINLVYRYHYFRDDIRNRPIYFDLCIENLSRLPITVSRMFLKDGNDNLMEFNWRPENVYTNNSKLGGEIKKNISVNSEVLPQKAEGLGYIGGMFVLETSSQYVLDSNSKVKFILHTNRGKKEFDIQLTDNPICTH